MKLNLWFVLVLVGVMCAAFSIQRIEAQSTGPANLYSRGPIKLTIATRSGQLLTSLDIPDGVSLGISAPSASSPDVSGGTMLPMTFSGDVSIMTRPSNELVSGPLRDQMLASPLRLDVKDAVVIVTRQP